MLAEGAQMIPVQVVQRAVARPRQYPQPDQLRPRIIIHLPRLPGWGGTTPSRAVKGRGVRPCAIFRREACRPPAALTAPAGWPIPRGAASTWPPPGA